MQPVPEGEYLASEPRRWPTVLGVLAIVWGVIGLASAGSALAGVGQSAQPAVMREGLGGASSAVAALLAAGLAVGGVQLLRHRPSGVRLLQAWAPLTMLVQGAVLALMVTHRAEFERSFREGMEREAEARAQRAGVEPARLPQGMEKVMWGVGVGCGGVMALVPPGIAAIFVFGRRGREAVAEWTAALGA